MDNLKEFKQYVSGHWLVDKTILTTCKVGHGSFKTTEPRLWVYFVNDENPTLVKSQWLDGYTNSEYLKQMFRQWLAL